MSRPTLLLLLLVLVACRPARPASDASSLRDNATVGVVSGTQTVTVSHDGARYTFKPDRTDLRLVELRDLSLFGAKKGKIANLKAKSWITVPAASFGLEVVFAPDVVCKSIPANTAVGVALKGQIAVNCVSVADQTRELKDVCRELSADTTVASFDDMRDYCTCWKRRATELKYVDSLGQKNLFRAECKNVGSKDILKGICGDIRDRFCKTCKLEDLACECPKGATLTYSQYLNDPEQFRTACMDGVTPPSNGAEAQQFDRFRSFCNRAGGSFLEGAKLASGRPECECRGTRRYVLDDYEYYKDREETFRSLCLSD